MLAGSGLRHRTDIEPDRAQCGRVQFGQRGSGGGQVHCDNPPADALLIRPDGYVAWAGANGLTAAIERWFDPQPANQ